MRASYLLFSLMFILISCSGKAPTKAKFVLEMNNMALNAAGGLVITGKGPNKETFSKIVSSNSVEMDLAKGSWEFSAAAWAGPLVFEGEVRCASTVALLAGDKAQVNLALTNGNCFTATFASESGDGAPLSAGTITPRFCESDVSSTNTPCQYDPSNPVAPANKSGFVGSYRIVVQGDKETGDLSSSCYDPDTNQVVGDSANLSNLNIPAFASNTSINVIVKAYFGESCEEAKGVLELSTSDNTKSKFYVNSAFNKDLFAKVSLSDICSKSLSTTFASGTGSNSNPHVICNRKQLIHLQNNWSVTAVTNNSYILANDIDLSSGIFKGVAGPEIMDACLELGDSFVPLGKVFDGSCNLIDNGSNYAGVFDGNKKTIKHFRIKNSSANDMGFISRVTAGSIYDLNFESADVEGDSQVGIVSGTFTVSFRTTPAAALQMSRLRSRTAPLQ